MVKAILGPVLRGGANLESRASSRSTASTSTGWRLGIRPGLGDDRCRLAGVPGPGRGRGRAALLCYLSGLTSPRDTSFDEQGSPPIMTFDALARSWHDPGRSDVGEVDGDCLSGTIIHQRPAALPGTDGDREPRSVSHRS